MVFARILFKIEYCQDSLHTLRKCIPNLWPLNQFLGPVCGALLVQGHQSFLIPSTGPIKVCKVVLKSVWGQTGT